jgi:hypothetical protein
VVVNWIVLFVLLTLVSLVAWAITAPRWPERRRGGSS